MAKTRGLGLLMLWCDVDPEHEEELNRRYDGEHIQRLLSVPGFLDAGRYVALKGGSKYLAMYELEDHLVLQTSAFLAEVRYRPSPWRQKSSGGHVGRNYILNAYRQIFPARATPVEATGPMPPYLQMGRMDVPAALEEEFKSAQVPHGLRLRAGRRAAERGVDPCARSQSVDAPCAPAAEARRRLARRVPADLAGVSARPARA